MKIDFKPFFVLSLQFLFIQVFSQSPDTIYFNNLWQICEKSFATYYRLGTAMQLDSFVFYSGPVHDYYLSDTLQMEGAYSKGGEKEGTFSFYYPNGKLQARGSFTKNEMYGPWNFFYNNGNKEAKIYYSGDENSFIVLDYFDSVGNQMTKDGTGKFEMNVNYIGNGFYKLGGGYKLIGEFSNGKREGVWKYFGKNYLTKAEDLLFKEIYNKGKFKKGESYSGNSVYSQSEPMTISNLPGFFKFKTTERFSTDESSFTISKMDPSEKDIFLTGIAHGNSKDTIGAFRKVEVEAQFAGGEAAWKRFLELNLRPHIAYKNLPKGTKNFTQTVWIEFIVCTDGTVCEIKTIDNIYPSLVKEAERVIKLSSGYWKPAIQYGRAVKAFRKQPITFRYEED